MCDPWKEGILRTESGRGSRVYIVEVSSLKYNCSQSNTIVIVWANLNSRSGLVPIFVNYNRLAFPRRQIGVHGQRGGGLSGLSRRDWCEETAILFFPIGILNFSHGKNDSKPSSESTPVHSITWV